LFDLGIVLSSVLNGLTMGAVYTLIALGLTLIYGVLHIINFAHGAALMMALFAVYGLNQFFGLDPYASIAIVVPAMFVFGYTLQRFVIERASHERDENILLVTLGVSIVMENLALILFHSDTRSIDSDYTLSTVTLLGCVLARAKVIAFVGAMVVSALLVVLIQKTDLGRAIRAVAKEKQGARLMGINVEHVYAMSFGIGMASLGAAAAFLLPSFYVNPTVGNGFVLVAFTIVVLGGMGSFLGAWVGGLLVGVVESVGGLFLGDSLGQAGIFLIFIVVLLFRPQGLFGAKT
jgi:branched-chain amino acid transport system permease protein